MVDDIYNTKMYQYAEYFYNQEQQDIRDLFGLMKEASSIHVADYIDYDRYCDDLIKKEFACMVDSETGKLKLEYVKKYWEKYADWLDETRLIDGRLVFDCDTSNDIIPESYEDYLGEDGEDVTAEYNRAEFRIIKSDR